MNGRLAKKIKKMPKRHGQEYLRELRGWSFQNRLRLAWWLLFGDKKAV